MSVLGLRGSWLVAEPAGPNRGSWLVVEPAGPNRGSWLVAEPAGPTNRSSPSGLEPVPIGNNRSSLSGLELVPIGNKGAGWLLNRPVPRVEARFQE